MPTATCLPARLVQKLFSFFLCDHSLTGTRIPAARPSPRCQARGTAGCHDSCTAPARWYLAHHARGHPPRSSRRADHEPTVTAKSDVHPVGRRWEHCRSSPPPNRRPGRLGGHEHHTTVLGLLRKSLCALLGSVPRAVELPSIRQETGVQIGWVMRVLLSQPFDCSRPAVRQCRHDSEWLVRIHSFAASACSLSRRHCHHDRSHCRGPRRRPRRNRASFPNAFRVFAAFMMRKVPILLATLLVAAAIRGANIGSVAYASFFETCVPTTRVDCAGSTGLCFFWQGTCTASPAPLRVCTSGFSTCGPASCDGTCDVSPWWPCSVTGPGC